MTSMLQLSPTRLRRLFFAELKLSAWAARKIGIATIGLILLASLVLMISGIRVDFSPTLGRGGAVVGLITPFAIWRDEPLFSRRVFFDRPTDKAVLIATRGAAGLVWLIVAVLVLIAASLILASATGGRFDPAHAPFGIQRPLTAVVAPRPWAAFPILSAAMISYLTGTAVAVGVRFPLRWMLVGLAAGITLWLVAVDMGTANRLSTVLTGPFGIDAALTGGWRPTLNAGPDAAMTPNAFGTWLGAVTIWLGAALGVAILAALRHRDL